MRSACLTLVRVLRACVCVCVCWSACAVEKAMKEEMKQAGSRRESLLRRELEELEKAATEVQAEMAQALTQAELRVAEQVKGAVEEAVMETELLAMEAAMAAECASNRAEVVERQLQHQASLLQVRVKMRSVRSAVHGGLSNSEFSGLCSAQRVFPSLRR